jgi:hypothetical protein
MGEVSQSGRSIGAQSVHPDADQLSAFLEHILPAHEREGVLAHLAICRECRETVALALPPLEETEKTAAAAAAPVAVRRHWIARWNVWAPATAVIAALALFVAFLVHEPRQGPTEQARMAAPPAPSPVQATSGAPAPIPPSAKEASGNTREAVERKKTVPPLPAPPPAAEFNELQGKEPLQSITTDRMLSMARNPASTPTGNAEAPAREAPGAAGGSSGAAVLRSQVVPQAQPKPTAGKTANAALQPPPAPVQAAQTVSVASAQVSGIETSSADVANASIPPVAIHGAILQPQLPSRLNALSTVAYGTRMLAIDAHNAVFMSKDSGQRWKRVKGPWQGHPVKVRLVLGSEGRGAVEQAGVMGSLSGFSTRDEALAGRAGASLTGAVTDRSGAVIPNATVVVTDAATRTTRTVKTGADGRYAVSGLAPGAYGVEASATGFETAHLTGIAVDAAHANVANLTLEVGTASETVTVQAAGPETAPSGARAPRRKAATPAPPPPALFEITTDTGERWTSTDGKHWKQD